MAISTLWAVFSLISHAPGISTAVRQTRTFTSYARMCSRTAGSLMLGVRVAPERVFLTPSAAADAAELGLQLLPSRDRLDSAVGPVTWGK